VHSAAITDVETLGLVLREARLERGLTQAQLAERIGVRQSYIAQLEAGKATKAFERLFEVARETGLTVTARSTHD